MPLVAMPGRCAAGAGFRSKFAAQLIYAAQPDSFEYGLAIS